MPALIDLRRRIRSVRNTQLITQAMKTVSTAKFKKSQRTVLEARPYWHNLPRAISEVISWAEPESHPLLAKRDERRVEGLVITSDKGLAGAFNSNLLAAASSFFEEKAGQARVRLILIGKKAVTFFRKHPFPVDLAYSERTQKFSGEELRRIAQLLVRLYVFSKVDAVYVAYNEFKSILSPRLTVTKLLPIEAPEEEKNSAFLPPDWEPGARALVDHLLPLLVEVQIQHFFFESLAAEHAARMMAMDNATRNAEELINDLVLVLNKTRQASITKELLEIMTAVEALAQK
jgi:F-type H+-transporting ATPase subunit gamma